MKPTLGFALTGSFCTIKRVLRELEALSEDYDIVPIVSYAVAQTDTRFGSAQETLSRLNLLTGREPLRSLADVEPFGPQKLLDLLVIAPCTGNTLAKLAAGISDTPVTLAAKAHLRNARPLLLAPSTNDALAANAKNIGLLLQTKHVFFVPFSQDDAEHKPTSLVSDFSLLRPACRAALQECQLQPILR